MPVLMKRREDNKKEFGRIYTSDYNNDKYIWMDEMIMFGWPEIYFINYEDYIKNRNNDVRSLPANSIRYTIWSRYDECCPFEKTENIIDITDDKLSKSLGEIHYGDEYWKVLKSQKELSREEVYPEAE